VRNARWNRSFLERIPLSSWVLGGIILGTFVTGLVIVVGAFAISSTIETWRERVPVPQLTNPALEGATAADLARAVDMLRRAEDPSALLELAKLKSARASGRLSQAERRQLVRAWQIARRSGA